MSKFSFEVVNFSGIPYDKPDIMRVGRVKFVEQHLIGSEPSKVALVRIIETINQDQQRSIDIFKDSALGNHHLAELMNMLKIIHKDKQNDARSMFLCEQVIGRVLRILNRPKSPSIAQIYEYNRNLAETLMLAKYLSDFGFNWRKVGQWLMLFSLVAVISAGVAFCFLSAPVSFALAGAAVILGVMGWCLNRYALITMEELVTDFVKNIKPFSSNDVAPPSDYHSYGNDEPIDVMASKLYQKYIKSELQYFTSYKLSEHQSCEWIEDFVYCNMEDKLISVIKNRLNAGDDLYPDFECNVLMYNQGERQKSEYFERIAAISGLTVIKQADNIIDLVETSELYAKSQLDPLGAEDPQAALQKAYEEYMSHSVVETTFLHSVSERFYGLGKSITSFFAPSQKKSNEQLAPLHTHDQELFNLLLCE